MKRKHLATVLAFVALLAANTLMAQEEIKPLWVVEVSTASKQEEKLSDAPGIITVVTQEELHGYGAVTLEDVINRITGMYFIHGGIFFWNLGSVRGQYTSDFDNHVLILINGRPVRDGMSGGFNSVVYNGFPLESIDHIEVVRGPGSVLYGTNAFSGVINIITKKPKEGKTEVGANVRYGSYNTFTQSVFGNVNVNEDLDINFGLRNFMDDGPEFGFWDSPYPPYNIPSQLGEGKFTKANRSVFLNANYKDFHYNGFYSDADMFTLGLPFNWQIGNKKPGDEIKKYYRLFSDLGYTHKFSEKYSLDLNFTYNYFKATGWVDGDTDPEALKGLSKVSLFEGAFRANPIEKLHLIVGALYDYNDFGGAQMQDDNLGKYSIYLQADYKLLTWMKLIAGAQLNKPEYVDASISPRFGAVANFDENWGAKALYSSAFRDAYPIESFVNHPSYEGNIYLKPELINTLDAQVFYQAEKLQASVTYFNSHMDDLVRTVPFDTLKYQFSNVGKYDFQGLEFEGKAKVTEGLDFQLSFIWQENEDDNGVKDAVAWPSTIVKAGFLYKYKYLNAGVFNSSFGKPSQIQNPVIDKNPEAGAYNLLTANVSVDILKALKPDCTKSLTLSIFADNLLDESIWFPEFVRQTVNSIPLQGGRAFYGMASFRF